MEIERLYFERKVERQIMTQSVLGIVGGSGFYDLPGLSHARWEKISGPWGDPSDEILFAELHGLPVRFLPRHGRGHRLSPTGINIAPTSML